MTDTRIDGGRPFDWGKTSADYAKYRDIYPPAFYKMIANMGLCNTGYNILDTGTGTAVLPRALCDHPVSFAATDVSAEQIEYAKMLCEQNGIDVDLKVGAAEDILFSENSFDVITACQCYWYFDHDRAAKAFHHQLKPHGKLVFMLMNWLPNEDEIAQKSEEMVLKYNPDWSGNGFTRSYITAPPEYSDLFKVKATVGFDIDVTFTRESWHGRMLACRGVGASLDEKQLAEFDKEHSAMLRSYPESFDIHHYAAITILESKKE